MAFSVLNQTENREQTLPRGIRLRRGTAEDEFATFEVMRRAMGYEMQWTQHAHLRHHLRDSPHCSFWLAEETPLFGAPKVIGYARSIVREAVWSLTEFFVLPGHHRQGIGGALLDCCLADGVQAGAETQMVLASQHPGADALYVRKAGCYPRLPMLLLAGPLISLRVPNTENAAIDDEALLADARVTAPSATLRAEPLVRTPEVAAEIDALDREIVGYARPPEHDFWEKTMGGPQGIARLFRRLSPSGKAGPLAGYAYLSAYSSGPALAVAPADLPRMLVHMSALFKMQAHEDGGFEPLETLQQYWAVAGTNEVMLHWLLSCGWQIVFQYLFMNSRPLGKPEHYVCHNPLYIL